MIQYTTDNRGFFTAGARSDYYMEDFVYWQPQALWSTQATTLNRPIFPGITQQQMLDSGPLVKYMGKHFNQAVWTCPSDPGNHTGTYPYPYSYTMNFMINCELNNSLPGGPNAVQWMGGRVLKMNRVRSPSSCVMMLEESAASINDGYTTLVYIPAGATSTSQITFGDTGHDRIAVEHDAQARYPDDGNYMPPKDKDLVPNSAARGICVFCDGHADWVTRQYVQSPLLRHWDPSF